MKAFQIGILTSMALFHAFVQNLKLVRLCLVKMTLKDNLLANLDEYRNLCARFLTT